MANSTTLEKPETNDVKPEETIKNTRNKPIDYDAINKMDSFNKFVKKKSTFLFGTTAVFLTLYILLPILAFTPVLQQKWIGNITGVWVYSAGLFVMTVVLCMVYTKVAPKFDKMAADVIREYEQQQQQGGAK